MSVDTNILFCLTAIAAAVGILATYAQARRHASSSKLPLPPSAKGSLPLFGHLLSLNPHAVHKSFAQMAKELKSSIISVKMGPDLWIVLSHPKVIHELFDQRGENYSSRKNGTIMDILTMNGNMFGFSHDNDYWRSMRRSTSISLSKSKIKANYSRHFNLESLTLMNWLIGSKDPSGIDYSQAISLYTTNLMTSVIFNYRFESIQDKIAQEIFQISHEFLDLVAVGLVDWFPYFELLNWRHIRHAQKLQQRGQSLFGNFLLKPIRDARECGKEIECVANDYLRGKEDQGFSETNVVQNLFSLTMAGIDPILGACLNLINILVNHPEIQDKAYDEIAHVVGLNRLPGEDDELPYLQAVIKENLRFRPLLMMGIPHRTREEDVYQGYRIPAATLVIINNYAVNFDPEVYDDPFSFKPERFLSSNGDLPGKRDHFVFGAGRRICVGTFFTEKALAMLFSRLLWAFKILPALDKDGKEIPVPLMGTDCVMFCVAPNAKVRFVPRHDDVERILKA